MGNGSMKDNQNTYFRARKEAALSNEKLNSRNGSAELLGVSPSTLADYELGLTKVVPVDKVALMADLYNCPELKNEYCKCICPIGKTMPIAIRSRGIEGTVLRFIQEFNKENISQIIKSLIEIASDEEVSKDKKKELEIIVGKMDELAIVISEVKLFVEKALKG